MIPTHEKIETIVNSYLTDRTTKGAMGTLVEIAPRTYRVVADGNTVIVFLKWGKWIVRFKSVEAKDFELINAAREALERGSKVEVSKHADLAKELGLEDK
jgi:hypothetical protein